MCNFLVVDKVLLVIECLKGGVSADIVIQTRINEQQISTA